MRGGGPGTSGYITIVVPGVALADIVKKMARSGGSCAYDAMRASCCRSIVDNGVIKVRGGSEERGTFSTKNISRIVRRMGWPDHVDGAPLTAEMVVAVHKSIGTNCYVLGVEMGPIVKYKVVAHTAGHSGYVGVASKNTRSGIYVQFPGSDGVSLHLEAITDEGVRTHIDRYMSDDPFGSKIPLKAPLADASTASDVIVEGVARHAREQMKKKSILGKRQARPDGGAEPSAKHEAPDPTLFADEDAEQLEAPCTNALEYPMYTDRDRIIEVDGTEGMCREPLHAPLAGGWFWYNIFVPGPLQVIGSSWYTGGDKQKRRRRGMSSSGRRQKRRP